MASALLGFGIGIGCFLKGATTRPAHGHARYHITLSDYTRLLSNRMREEYYQFTCVPGIRMYVYNTGERFYNTHRCQCHIASASQVQATSTTAPSGAEIQRKAVERFQLQIEIHRHKNYTIMVMYANTTVTANTDAYIVEAQECTQRLYSPLPVLQPIVSSSTLFLYVAGAPSGIFLVSIMFRFWDVSLILLVICKGSNR